MQPDKKDWRSIPGYPRYRISEFGEVEDVDAGAILPTSLAARGNYPKVCLRDHLGGTVHHAIHRLVAQTYIGPPPSADALVMHLNHDTQDNHYNNLAWGTHATNAAGRLERGTVLRGEQLHNAVVTKEKAEAIRSKYSEGMTTTELADAFGISRQNVNNIVRFRSWRHVGGPSAPMERRRKKGEKLTETQVRAIRAAAASGVPQSKIAAQYGISQGAVSAIVTGKRWGHVK